MNKYRKTRRHPEKGIALLIAIFVLLLISVVAIALLVSSSTETALGANYRASSTVYYAALAGLEEARGRLAPKNPTHFTSAVIPTPFPLGQAVYVMNRLTGENVMPWDTSNPYYDKEYGSEFFPLSASSTGIQPAYSVWDYTNSPIVPGPMYKWVRITAATEQSLYLDVDSNGYYDNSLPIYYDPAQVDSHGNPSPGLVVTPTPPPTAVQVLQITALAYLPNGSQKLLQYVVAPTALNLSFPAALTMDGPNAGSNATHPVFSVPYSAAFIVKGDDQEFYSSSGGCALGSNPTPHPVRAIGYTVNGGGDTSNATITGAIGSSNHGDYVGSGGLSPNVYYVGNPPPPGPPTLASNLQSLSGLNSTVTTLTQNADLTINGTVTPVQQNDSHNVMPATMSATNPMTVVVNGDLDFTGWSGTGYGVLLVTGTFTYDPDVIVEWNYPGDRQGKSCTRTQGWHVGQFNGAVLWRPRSTARETRCPLHLHSALPTFNFTLAADTVVSASITAVAG